jgi:hypothetical protein
MSSPAWLRKGSPGWLQAAAEKAKGSFKSLGQRRRPNNTAVQWAVAKPKLAAEDINDLNRQLRKACVEGKIMDARRLIDRGASLHACDEAFERTPLHFAALNGHVEVVRMLCARKADPNARDLSDLDALHLAAERGWSEVIDVLIRDCNANVLARSTNGRTALHHAAFMNHEDSVAVLCDFMTERGMIRVVTFHDDRFAQEQEKNDFSKLTDNWGQTPLDLAAERGHAHLVTLMEGRRLKRPKAQKLVTPAGESGQEKLKRTPRSFPGFGPIGGGGGGKSRASATSGSSKYK